MVSFKRLSGAKRAIVAAAAMLIAALPCVAQTRFAEFPTDSDRALLARVIAAEDARELTPAIRAALGSSNPALRRFAVRSVGRLERGSLAYLIVPLLSDAVPAVRSAAAQALAQATSHDDASVARGAIVARLTLEKNDSTLGELAEALGRLAPRDSAEFTDNADWLVGASLDQSSDNASVAHDARPVTLRGAVRGLYFLSRHPRSPTLLPDVSARIRQLMVFGRGVQDTGAAAAYIRTVAAMTLVGARAARMSDVDQLLTDPVAAVRDQGVAASASFQDTAPLGPIVVRGLQDSSAQVRFRAVAVYDRRLRATAGCVPLMTAAHDSNVSVALTAIDALGSCRPDFPAARLLDSIAGSLPAHPYDWHRSAHALVSLAGAAPVAARRRFDLFLADTNFFVRTYLARAAARLRDTTLLVRLAAPNEHPNVRSEAIDGLLRTIGPAGDSIYIAALSSDASQLLQSASKALSGSTNSAAGPALLAALRRVNASERETMRDARVAILQALKTEGRGAPTDSFPKLSPVPLPTLGDLQPLETRQADIEMENGDRIILRFFPLDAPTNAWRFARQARAGFFDGLTFHRVVPWFVVQGGSPGANEYMGDARFTRDELGLENRRGTVGLSTRGRDTGDGQLYFNLIDNVRLDHDYTVWGEVIAGMSAVDHMQEGARIKRITIQ